MCLFLAVFVCIWLYVIFLVFVMRGNSLLSFYSSIMFFFGRVSGIFAALLLGFRSMFFLLTLIFLLSRMHIFHEVGFG